MKKYILGAAFFLVLASPSFSQAQTTSSDSGCRPGDFYSSLTGNKCPNAPEVLGCAPGDLYNSLSGERCSTTPVTTSGFCYNFNTDLTLGSSGADVTALNQALSLFFQKEVGLGPVFDEDTAGVVVQFQGRNSIRQTGYVGPITRAKLNNLYGCSTDTNTPRITSIFPNQIPLGSNAPITLLGTNLNSTLMVGLTGPGADTAVTPTYVSPGGEKVTFTFPADIKIPGNYAVYVFNFGVPVYSTINLNVIQTSAPTITVGSPAAGDTLYIGKTTTISWVPSITNANARYSFVFRNTSGQGTFSGGSFSAAESNCDAASKCYVSFTVPDYQPLVSPSVTLSVYDDAGRYGTSGTFAITSGSTVAKDLTVLNPTAGMTFVPGEKITVSWTSSGNADAIYNVLYYTPYGKSGIGIFTASQANCSAADKCYVSWTVPNITASDVKISVSDSATRRGGVSGSFSIGTITPTSITVTYPRGGETFVLSSTTLSNTYDFQTTWKSINATGNVNVYLVPMEYAYTTSGGSTSGTAGCLMGTTRVSQGVFWIKASGNTCLKNIPGRWKVLLKQDAADMASSGYFTLTLPSGTSDTYFTPSAFTSSASPTDGFELNYSLTARGGDVYLSPFTKVKVDRAGNIVTNGITINRTTSATVNNAGLYKIAEGQTERFTVKVAVQPSLAGGSGLYRAALESLSWGTDPSDSTPDYVYTFPVEYKTNYVSLDSINWANPTITSMSQNQGTQGDTIAIYGTNLAGTSNVEFYTSNGTLVGSLPPTSVGATKVAFTITGTFAGMLGTNTYQVGVVTNNCAGGCSSNRLPFTLTAPTTGPSITLTASAGTITDTNGSMSVPPGTSITYKWSTTGATSCFGFEEGAYDAWYGAKATSGSITLPSPSVTAKYRLSCSANGVSVEKSITVIPSTVTAPAPTITSFLFPDLMNQTTGSTVIKWAASAATDAALEVECTPGTISFTTSKGNAPICEKGGVWNWTSSMGDSITVTPVGNTQPVGVTFKLSLLRNGVPITGQSKTIYASFPAIASTPTGPQGSITASQGTCTIPDGASSCSALLSWTTNTSVRNPRVTYTPYNGPETFISSDANRTNYSVNVARNTFVYKLYDGLTTVLSSTQVTGSCKTGSTWDSIKSQCVSSVTTPTEQPPTITSAVSKAAADGELYQGATAFVTGSNFTSPAYVILSDSAGNVYTLLMTVASSQAGTFTTPTGLTSPGTIKVIKNRGTGNEMSSSPYSVKFPSPSITGSITVSPTSCAIPDGQTYCYGTLEWQTNSTRPRLVYIPPSAVGGEYTISTAATGRDSYGVYGGTNTLKLYDGTNPDPITQVNIVASCKTAGSTYKNNVCTPAVDYSTWLTNLYWTELGRAPDPGGYEYWLGRLNSGMASMDVAAAFRNSAEGVAAQFVIGLYKTYLGRDPVATKDSGITWWVNQITSGAQTRAAVDSAFCNSIEARNYNSSRTCTNGAAVITAFAQAPAATPSVRPARYTFTEDLYRGQTGAEVAQLQKVLGIEVTGNFYDVTREAVMQYQLQNGIKPTGYVGPATRAVLNSR